MKRVDPCETCANRPGCEAEFGERGCHYYPAWGSPAFDRITTMSEPHQDIKLKTAQPKYGAPFFWLGDKFILSAITENGKMTLILLDREDPHGSLSLPLTLDDFTIIVCELVKYLLILRHDLGEGEEVAFKITDKGISLRPLPSIEVRAGEEGGEDEAEVAE